MSRITARDVLAFALRLVVYVPLLVAGALCHGIAAAFETLGDGINKAARAMRQLTCAPYVKELHARVEEAEACERARLLRQLHRWVDE